MKFAWVLLVGCLATVAAAAPRFAESGHFSIEIDGKPRSDVGEVAKVLLERRVERSRTGDELKVFTRVTNHSDRDLTLGNATLLECTGSLTGSGAPAAVYINGSTLACEPNGPVAARGYSGSLVALAGPDRKSALTIGFLTAAAARPQVSATYRADGKISVSATQNLLGRKLRPKDSLDLDVVYVASNDDPFAALVGYGDAVAGASPVPVRHGVTSLWCSWYAHRMAMTEDLVLANAAVAAKYFKPLGFEIMQLDHGWQRGDVTGDWVPNERFPHGLKWLSEQLQSRYGLKLGLWIAPTDVAESSQLGKEHPDWLLKGPDGKPLVNWKWYWKPNPNCFELDATNPAAAKWLRETFARLHSEGASYFKIDFIASSGGEQFAQSDPYATRGWTNLRTAMDAIRAGAGKDAWIRYCQPPPRLAVGLANSAYGGDDTADAGVPGMFHVLRDNARSLAAGWWINDRLYHREVCDMSVRMQADVEETRVRLAIMTLAGCSISFSDELQHLPLSRIRMMQQCLPPGGPAMRPIDLFDRVVPSIWHLHCKNAADEWDVVGLFNFEDTPQERAIDFATIGLPGDADVTVYEFWEQKFEGVRRGEFSTTLQPHTCRVYAIRKAADRPQVIGSDMHLLQGFHEFKPMKWDKNAATLSGVSHRAKDLDGRLSLFVPTGWEPKFDFPLVATSAHLTHVAGNIWAYEMQFDADDRAWSIPFQRSK
jgi:hypothetical protein